MASRTKLAEEVAGLSQRVDRFTARVEERFDGVDLRIEELRRHFDVIAEASRDDFRNLYDLVQAHMARMDARTDTLEVRLRAETKLGYDALDSRVTVLERKAPAEKHRR